MYSGLVKGLEGGSFLIFRVWIGLEMAEGASMSEVLGVGLHEAGLEAGSVQWLMMVEVVFGTSLAKARGVFRRGVLAKYIWTSRLWTETRRVDGVFGTASFRLELSCSKFMWLMILENVLEGSLGECVGESSAASLTGNEGAERGWTKDDMMGSWFWSVAPLTGSELAI